MSQACLCHLQPWMTESGCGRRQWEGGLISCMWDSTGKSICSPQPTIDLTAHANHLWAALRANVGAVYYRHCTDMISEPCFFSSAHRLPIANTLPSPTILLLLISSVCQTELSLWWFRQLLSGWFCINCFYIPCGILYVRFVSLRVFCIYCSITTCAIISCDNNLFGQVLFAGRC